MNNSTLYDNDNSNDSIDSLTWLINIVTIMSFILQLQNNDELQKQSSNDEVLERLHNDVMEVLEDNRKLSNTIIEQNNEILNILKGDKTFYEKT